MDIDHLFVQYGDQGAWGQPAKRLGLGPDSVQELDFVCILQGARVPFIVRITEDGKYKLIGEAFVFGFMAGEAILLPKTFKKQEIMLV